MIIFLKFFFLSSYAILHVMTYVFDLIHLQKYNTYSNYLDEIMKLDVNYFKK